MSFMRKPTERQKRVFREGAKAEEKAAEWLKEHGFRDVKRNPRPTGCWDMKARKGKQRWIIEVKTGKNPSINLANFEKMIKIRGF